MWRHRDGFGDDLACDWCSNSLVHAQVDRNRTLNEARRIGWRAIEFETNGGKWSVIHKCPKCITVSRPSKVERLEGEEPLFDVEARKNDGDTH